MSPALLLALLALPAAAEDAALPAQSAAAVAGPDGSPSLPPPAETVVENLIRVKVHKEAKEWEPVSLRKGGDPAALKTRFTRRIIKGKGQPCGARAIARAHAVKDDRMLIVSIFPTCLKTLRKHLEVRYLIIEGYLEKVQAAVVTAERGGAPDDDSALLSRRKVPYLEEFPGEGLAKLAAFSLANGEGTVNAAALSGLEFADSDVGVASLAYKVVGLGPRRAIPKPKPADKAPEAAPAVAAPAAAKGYQGPFGCSIQLPDGFEGEKVDPMRQGGSAVSFHPKGSQEGAVRLEALPIDNAAVGGRADLPVYKAQISEQLKGTQSQFTTTDVSLPYPGFEIKVTMPHPQMIIVLQGKKTIYVFSTTADGPVLRGLTGGLKDPS